MKNPTAIILADWHIRESAPACRTDVFLQTQAEKVKFITALQNKHAGIPILCAGDLLDKWNSSPWLISWCIANLPRNIFTVYGQHELPYHSFEKRDKSALHTLEQARSVAIVGVEPKPIMAGWTSRVWGLSWGSDFKKPGFKDLELSKKGLKILMLHALVSNGLESWAGMIDAYTPDQIFDLFPQFDLIVTGDNHTPIVSKRGKQILINPGSVMRTTAAQVDHHPRIYLWDARTHEVEPVHLPIRKSDVNVDSKRLEGDLAGQKIAAFITHLSSFKEGIDVSFEHNLKKFFKEHDTDKETQKLIYKAMEGK